MITVHHLNESRSQRVLWLLEELSVPYEIKFYQRDKDRRAPKEYCDVHPLGKSPVITDGPVTLAESGAIVEYLISKYGNGKLQAPTSGQEYLDNLYFTHYAEGSLMPILAQNIIYGLVPQHTPFFIRPIASMIFKGLTEMLLVPEFKRHFEMIESHLKKNKSGWFANGDEPTAADFQMFFPLELIVTSISERATPKIIEYVRQVHSSDKVYGVTNCHVLRKNTAVEYEHKDDAPKDHVRVCGMLRFERGVHEIESAIIDREDVVEDRERDLAKLENANQDATIVSSRRISLDLYKAALTNLKAFRKEVEKDWSNMKVDRNIGYVQYTAPIMVDVEGGTLYTSDWGAFVANEEKVKENFEGNVIDIGVYHLLYKPRQRNEGKLFLGSKYSRRVLTEMFYPRGGSPTTFKFPEGRKLRIVGCATEAEIKNPADRDHDDEPCLIVGKDGNTTDLTVGRYAGLESFSRNDEGIESMELAIYNMDNDAELFSDIGDSGSLVWFMKDGKAYMLGQLHSGHHKGGSTGNHVTYCTPAWYLLEQIRKKFPYADFYQTSWSS
ncbi:hypothetical protein H0H93_005020 [Arthromyces matolae]|nr:hypothetical protein H0H93_005020 [Arthromyces matolae]